MGDRMDEIKDLLGEMQRTNDPCHDRLLELIVEELVMLRGISQSVERVMTAIRKAQQ